MTQLHPGPARQDAPQRPSRKWLAPTGVGLGVGLATLALHLRDPHQSGTWGLCPMRSLTGLDCPLCGGLRSVNDLSNGDLSAAWYSNALFVASIPTLVGLWLWWLVASLTGRPTPSEHRWAKYFMWGYVAIGLAFWVFRNTPWGQDYWA